MMGDQLIAWLPEALKQDNNTSRKVACIVWYDKISNYSVSEPYLLDVIRQTPFDIGFDISKVVDVLVNDFGYDRKFALWRMGGRSCK